MKNIEGISSFLAAFTLLSFNLAPAHAAPVYEESFISAPGRFPANHGSTIVELKDGDFLSCWYAGAAEKAPDVQIYCSRFSAETREWGAPQVAVAAGETSNGSWFSNKTLGNPALFLDNEGVLWLFYTAVTLFNGWSAGHVDYKVSFDAGQTWSEGERMISMFGNLTRTKPLQLSDGQIMLPGYHELFGRKGFSCILQVKKGVLEDRSCRRIPKYDHLQPSLVQVAPNRVFAYLRVGKKKQFVHMSEYLIDEDRWSVPIPTNLPNPDASVDVVRAADGKFLMAYDDDHDRRAPLSLAFSVDGVSFTKFWDLEGDVTKDYSYPAFIRDSNGNYHVTYTYDFRSAIKHVMFNEEWLQQKLSAGSPR